jgi:flagellar motor switch protein FliM
MANIVTPSEVVVVSTFHIELEGGGGEFHLTIPYAMLEPIREALDAGVQSDVDDVDERWVKALQRDIMDTKVQVGCCLAKKQLMLRDMLDMQVGDVIPIEMPEHMVMYANEVPIFKARMGSSQGHLALKIIEPFQHTK